MRRLVAIAAAFALAACGKDSSPSSRATAPAPPNTSSRADASSVASSPPSPAPRLELLVNGQGQDGKVVAGWPVILQLEMTSPDGKPWRVSGGARPWSRQVRIEMPGDTPAFEAALTAPNEVTVAERTGAQLFWTIAPDASAKLARGERRLRAVLGSREAAGGAWTGVARSREIRVSVVDEPRPLPPEWAERKAEVEVDYVFCRQGAAAALALAEEATKAQTESWRLLAVKGNLLAGLDRRAQAVKALDEALALWWHRDPEGCGPPWELVARRGALEPDAAEK